MLVDVDGRYVKSLPASPVLPDDRVSVMAGADLSGSVRAGRGFSRDVHAARARMQQAEAQSGQALAQLLPSVSVRANYGEERSKPSVVVDEATGELVASDTHDRTDAVLTVTQPLFNLTALLDWRRRNVKVRASRENVRASDGDAFLSTVKSYLSLVSTRLQMDITGDYGDRLAGLLEYIKKRADAGAASLSDMSRVRARGQETRSVMLEQESAHLAAGIDFVRLTNVVPRTVKVPRPDEVGAGNLPASFEDAVSQAMKSNPELCALRAELAAAEINRDAALGLFLPRLDLEYSYNYSLHAGGEPSSQGQRDRRLMLVLNWDLFNSGRDYRYSEERAARYRELLYRLDGERRRVVQELSANYAVLSTTRQRIASGYRELAAIATAARAMSERMLSGKQSLLDLLDVYQRYYQARSRLVDLHVLEMNTAARLVRLITGIPAAAGDAAAGGN